MQTMELSVLFLSCRRIHYLRRTFSAIRGYFSDVEPQVRPIFICFDNGSTPQDQETIARLGFDRVSLSRENLGIGPAMNRLVAEVRTPCFLNLQDDWVIENPAKILFVDECLKLFAKDPRIGQIKLDACHFLDFHDRAAYDGPFRAEQGKVDFHVQNPEMLWGGFTFPPAITRTAAVHKTGLFSEDQPYRRGWAESEYSARFSRQFAAAKSPQLLLFKHIGEAATPGWTENEVSRAAWPQQKIPPAMPAAPTIACLLTAHRRPANLKRQYAAVCAQTMNASEIALWQNHGAGVVFDERLLQSIPHLRSANCNWGVWPRFPFCFEFKSEFVCVFDDDTIPGPRWFENCLATMRKHEGLLGANGVIFLDGSRSRQAKVGWINPQNEVTEVDIVGHAWFFRRDWLRYFSLEPRHGAQTCGEDYHFSAALQKHLGLPTLVPPHDPNDKSAWGSIEGDLGKDEVALYRQSGESEKKDLMHKGYLAAGWKPLALRKPAFAAHKPHFAHSARGAAPIRFTHDFKSDFELFGFGGVPFAFARFGDGEIALCTKRPIGASDGWFYNGQDSRYSRMLREAVAADIEGYYLGISCRCCDPAGHRWYMEHVRAPSWRVTFANIFVNANYGRFRALDLSSTLLVSSANGDFHVPRNAIDPEYDYEPLLEQLFKVEQPILVAAGPLSCILIYEYWKHAPRRQTIIDIGSALDPIIHGRPTRGYHDVGGAMASKVCVW